MTCLSSCSLLFVLQIIVTVHSQNSAIWDLASNELLPRNCGEDHGNRDLSREKTDIDEFPWVVLLETTSLLDTGKKVIVCNGFLISKRYVLTAASCVGEDVKSLHIDTVRLGEYDTSTVKDCVDSADKKSKICSNDPIILGIEEAFVHEGFSDSSSDYSNDIALIRLPQDVTFTEYIKPICLPSNPTITDKSVIIAAWGIRLGTESVSKIKLKFKNSLYDHANCSRFYNSVTKLVDSQICAQADDKDGGLCRGNGGGPLMTSTENRNNKRQWTAIGITSFGPSCSNSKPDVYTKVASYVPWILSKMRV